MCWNFCRVEIYYQTLNIQTITQSAQYNVSTLLTGEVLMNAPDMFSVPRTDLIENFYNARNINKTKI